MKLENQVISVEQAKKLKELGIDQSAYFSWENANITYSDKSKSRFSVERTNDYDIRKMSPLGYTYYSAFTVAELGVMLGDSHPSWSFKKPGTDETLFISTMIGPNDPLAKHKYKDADNYAYEIREIIKRTDQFAMDDDILKKPGIILF